MKAVPQWPSESEDRRLTTDLFAGMATAPGEIATAYLTPLIHFLHGKFRSTDPDVCASAAEDAILALVSGKTCYDPDRLTLRVFLKMATVRDLLNHRAKESRHRGISLESVAEPTDDGNTIRRDDKPTWDDPRLVAEMAAFDPDEHLALDLMRDGRRDTADFAGPLGLLHLAAGEQAAMVKRLKDRVKKRLSRAVGGDR